MLKTTWEYAMRNHLYNYLVMRVAKTNVNWLIKYPTN